MRLVWLETFIAAAEHKSMTAAGKVLGFDQSMASRNIADLEGWLGQALFDGNVPLALSPSGESFLPTAKAVVAMLDDARAKPGGAIKHTPISAADIKL